MCEQLIYKGSSEVLDDGILDHKYLLFLVLSGVATGASWPCYSRAL